MIRHLAPARAEPRVRSAGLESLAALAAGLEVMDDVPLV
jgi:hypothetical protein